MQRTSLSLLSYFLSLSKTLFSILPRDLISALPFFFKPRFQFSRLAYVIQMDLSTQHLYEELPLYVPVYVRRNCGLARVSPITFLSSFGLIFLFPEAYDSS